MIDYTDDATGQTGKKFYWEELRKELKEYAAELSNSQTLVLQLSINTVSTLCHFMIKEHVFETWMKEGLVPALQSVFKEDGASVSISNMHEQQMLLSLSIKGDKNRLAKYEFLHDLLDSLWKSISTQDIRTLNQIKDYTHSFVNAYWLEKSVNEHLDNLDEAPGNKMSENTDNKNRLKI